MTDPEHSTQSGPATAAAETERGDPDLIGRTVSGKYRIEKFLGGGAMGAVYKARFAALEKNVAVKVMHRAVAIDPNFVGRFHREAKAASRLDHPNSIRVIDFGEEPDGLLYIAMEYVEGRDLYRVIHEDWPISNADLGDMVMQALAAIAVAHEMGVIHRDLKPENLMILRAKNDEGREAYLVKVCDFGIAKITEKDDEPAPEGGRPGQKLTTQGLVVGTPEYMSPEQARGEKLDARSDIYSMGIILYQLLTGRTPFTADTALAVVLLHITESPEAPSVHYAGVHKGLEAVCLRALAKDRNDRFQTSREMRNAIREALDGRPAPVVDGAAPTALDLAAVALPTSPSASTLPLSADVLRVTAAVAHAPTVAGAISGSHLTPLGTTSAASPAQPRSSGSRVAIGLGLAAAVIAGGAYGARRIMSSASVETPLPSATSIVAPPTSPTLVATPASAPLATSTAEPPSPVVVDPKSTKPVVVAPPTTRGNPATTKVPDPPVTALAPPAPIAPVVEAPAPPPPPPVTVAPPPAAPTFNPASCRVSLGPHRTTGATATRDLVLNGGATGATWTGCAQRSIKERPAGSVTATVHLNYNDKGAFRGATCAGCPGALGACIQASRPTATLNIRSGDITGEPSFDVPLTLTCD